MKNQCQGCHAGWKVEAHNPWPKGSKPMYLHVVEGGYKGEKVVCTKHRYNTELPPQCWEGGSKEMCSCPDCGSSLVQAV